MKTIKKYEVKVRRVKLAEQPGVYSKTIRTPKDVADIAKILNEEDQEVFWIVTTDVRNRVTGFFECHRGTLEDCSVDPKIIFRNALLAGASGITLVHNHPSGDPTASPSDIHLTKRLIQGAKLLGLIILDHVIVSHEGFCSLRERYELHWEGDSDERKADTEKV